VPSPKGNPCTVSRENGIAVPYAPLGATTTNDDDDDDDVTYLLF